VALFVTLEVARVAGGICFARESFGGEAAILAAFSFKTFLARTILLATQVI